MVATHLSQLARADFFPEWSSLPSFAAEIDPFAYTGRLLVHKLVLDALNVHGAFGAGNELNPFWGNVFHLAWQWRSQRLTLPNSEPGRIHPHSMWGYANYAVSVIPLIAAINTGALKPVAVLPPYEHGVISYAHGGGKSAYIVPDEFSEALPAWSEFFRAALDLKPGDPDLDPLRFLFWRAQRASLLGVVPTIDERGLHYHTRNELNFMLGWIRLVDYWGAAAWRSDLDFMLRHGVGGLPERQLTADDKPGRSRGLSPRASMMIAALLKLTQQSKFRAALDLFWWKRAMRSPRARADAVELLDAKLHPETASPPTRSRLRRLMFLP